MKTQEIQRAYYGAIWLILIKKNDVEIQFTRGACKNQRFSAGSHRPDLYRVSDRDIKINKIAKSAPDCRRAYYGAIPRARAFSKCARARNRAVVCASAVRSTFCEFVDFDVATASAIEIWAMAAG